LRILSSPISRLVSRDDILLYKSYNKYLYNVVKSIFSVIYKIKIN
jgi:hypothetical protein